MMERLPMEIGRVVLSRQGRDAGRCFVVLQVVDDQYVLMADGLSSHQLLDSDLRKALKAAGLEIDQPLCKEG